MRTDEKLSKEAGDVLHRTMADHCIFRSCYNCDNMDLKTNHCRLYKAQPPVEVIMFSCGQAWTAVIPF